MENAIEVRGLCKQYRDFTLQNVDLTVRGGTIVGLIGENGAGKTTTLKALLGVIRTDGGTISIMGKDPSDPAARSEVGVVFEDSYVYGGFHTQQIDKIMSGIHKNWDSELFFAYCRRFGLEEKKAIKEFSRGMRMKMSLATALAHRPKLLILDEATSGLDPVVRGELLELFLEFIQDEDHAILLSSHITTDLERVADEIAYIRKGRLLFQRSKDELLETMGIVRAGAAVLNALPPELIAARKDSAWGCAALVYDAGAARRLLGGDVVLDRVTLDELMELMAERSEE